MRAFVLGSGSTGNCVIVESACGARVVLDAGLNPTAATRALRSLGEDLFPRGASAIFVSHHHGDHIAQLMPLARALKSPVFLHAGITAQRARQRLDVRAFPLHEPVRVGPFVVDAFPVPHDAPQIALRVAAHGRSFGMVTDLGHVPDRLVDFLGACDAALVEANHCPIMLDEGPYPPHLKQRVRGGLGHLSNEQTGELARRLVGRRISRLVLGHLSRTNNSPARALQVVSARCAPLAVEVVPNGESRAIAVERRAGHFAQLDLFA